MSPQRIIFNQCFLLLFFPLVSVSCCKLKDMWISWLIQREAATLVSIPSSHGDGDVRGGDDRGGGDPNPNLPIPSGVGGQVGPRGGVRPRGQDGVQPGGRGMVQAWPRPSPGRPSPPTHSTPTVKRKGLTFFHQRWRKGF